MWKAEGSARDLGHLSAPASPGLSAEGRGCSPRPLAVSLLGVGVTGGLLHTLRGLSREGEFGLFWALPGLGAPDSHGHCQRLPLGDSPFESSKLSALSGQRPGPEGVLEPRTRWGNLGLADACATPLLSVRPWTDHYILSPSRAGQTGLKVTRGHGTLAPSASVTAGPCPPSKWHGALFSRYWFPGVCTLVLRRGTDASVDHSRGPRLLGRFGSVPRQSEAKGARSCT